MIAPTFTEFAATVAPWLRLTAAQRALVSVMFDGGQPSACGTDLALRLFGTVDDVPPEARAVALCVVGRGSGKSLLGGLRLLHLGLTSDLSGLAPGEMAYGAIVAPSMRLARQTLRFVVGTVRALPALERLIVTDSADELVLQRPDGRVIAFACFAASARGSEVRGKSLFGSLLDEAAFFRDENFAVNDTEIYRAVAARVLPAGQSLICTTPWARQGLVWSLFGQNFGGPTTAIVAHASTELLRDDEDTRAMVARERRNDPENARREFDAEFMTVGATSFFDARTIDMAVGRPISDRSPAEIVVGADFGFRSDSSALVVVAKRGRTAEVVHVVEEQPTDASPLDFERVVDSFAETALRFGARFLVADLHYVEAVRARVARHGLYLVEVPPGATGKQTMFLGAKAALAAGLVSLPDHARLISQLRQVEQRATSGGGLQITSPRRAGGGHGDIVSALVAALWARPGGGAATLADGLRGTGLRSVAFGETSWPQRPAADPPIAPGSPVTVREVSSLGFNPPRRRSKWWI